MCLTFIQSLSSFSSFYMRLYFSNQYPIHLSTLGWRMPFNQAAGITTLSRYSSNYSMSTTYRESWRSAILHWVPVRMRICRWWGDSNDQKRKIIVLPSLARLMRSRHEHGIQRSGLMGFVSTRQITLEKLLKSPCSARFMHRSKTSSSVLPKAFTEGRSRVSSENRQWSP